MERGGVGCGECAASRPVGGMRFWPRCARGPLIRGAVGYAWTLTCPAFWGAPVRWACVSACFERHGRGSSCVRSSRQAVRGSPAARSAQPCCQWWLLRLLAVGGRSDFRTEQEFRFACCTDVLHLHEPPHAGGAGKTSRRSPKARLWPLPRWLNRPSPSGKGTTRSRCRPMSSRSFGRPPAVSFRLVSGAPLPDHGHRHVGLQARTAANSLPETAPGSLIIMRASRAASVTPFDDSNPACRWAR